MSNPGLIYSDVAPEALTTTIISAYPCDMVLLTGHNACWNGSNSFSICAPANSPHTRAFKLNRLHANTRRNATIFFEIMRIKSAKLSVLKMRGQPWNLNTITTRFWSLFMVHYSLTSDQNQTTFPSARKNQLTGAKARLLSYYHT